MVGRREGGIRRRACRLAAGGYRHGPCPGAAAGCHRYRPPELPGCAHGEPPHVEGELMTRVDPGGGGTVNVTPEDVAAAAHTFYTAQDDLTNAWQALQSALDANSGMAGDDDPAKSFDSKYEPAVSAAWKALRSSV